MLHMYKQGSRDVFLFVKKIISLVELENNGKKGSHLARKATCRNSENCQSIRKITPSREKTSSGLRGSTVSWRSINEWFEFSFLFSSTFILLFSFSFHVDWQQGPRIQNSSVACTFFHPSCLTRACCC